MTEFKVCFAPGRVGQEKCKKQCAECVDAQRRCTCGAAAGEQRSRLARARCPYHQHTCSTDERHAAIVESNHAARLSATQAAIRTALYDQGYAAPTNRAELLASVAQVLSEVPPAL
jgi:microcystin-dependent protein